MKFKDGSLPHLLADRIVYLFRFQELLRLYHNKKKDDYEAGKMTLEEFRDFQNYWFESRNHLICQEMNHCKDSFKKKNIAVDITSIEEDEQ